VSHSAEGDFPYGTEYSSPAKLMMRLPIGLSGPSLRATDGQGFLAASVMTGTEALDEVVSPSQALEEPTEVQPPDEAAQQEPQSPSDSPPGIAVVPGPKGRSRPGRYGLNIRFESREGDPDLGRLVESTVVINDAHPAYRRAVASPSEGYHIALAVALALARLAVPAAEEREFVTSFMIRWGEALDGPRLRSRKRS
jgi:hypothetical protein